MAEIAIDVPEDVLPIIDALGVPFSTWVVDRLRQHADSDTAPDLAKQLLVDAELVTAPTENESLATLRRMERSEPW